MHFWRCGAAVPLSRATLGGTGHKGTRYNGVQFPRGANRDGLRYVIRQPPPAQPVSVAVPRPVDEEGLALDLVALDEAPVAAVLRVVAVVAHHEVRVGR